MKPFFSIIIPSLNEEIALPRLLQNLEDQTNQDFEVIHVDGQSEDNTCEFAKKFKNLPDYKLIISPIRHVSHQRNLGAKVAVGEYLLFIDADTQLPSSFLEDLSSKLKNNPVSTFTTWSDPDIDNLSARIYLAVLNTLLDLTNFFQFPFAVGVFIGSTPEAFNTTGGFREDLHFGEDEEFVRHASKHGFNFKVFHSPRFIYSLRRFRQQGLMTNLYQIFAKKLKSATNRDVLKPKEYLMGGHHFRNDH